MVHVRHDEGHGLRLESVVGKRANPAKSEEKKRHTKHPSAVAAINRSDRAARLAPAWTQSHPFHIRFFFRPADVSCGIDPKTNGTRRVDVARGREENGEKVRERMEEKEGEREGGGE